MGVVLRLLPGKRMGRTLRCCRPQVGRLTLYARQCTRQPPRLSNGFFRNRRGLKSPLAAQAIHPPGRGPDRPPAAETDGGFHPRHRAPVPLGQAGAAGGADLPVAAAGLPVAQETRHGPWLRVCCIPGVLGDVEHVSRLHASHAMLLHIRDRIPAGVLCEAGGFGRRSLRPLRQDRFGRPLGYQTTPRPIPTHPGAPTSMFDRGEFEARPSPAASNRRYSATSASRRSADTRSERATVNSPRTSRSASVGREPLPVIVASRSLPTRVSLPAGGAVDKRSGIASVALFASLVCRVILAFPNARIEALRDRLRRRTEKGPTRPQVTGLADAGRPRTWAGSPARSRCRSRFSFAPTNARVYRPGPPGSRRRVATVRGLPRGDTRCTSSPLSLRLLRSRCLRRLGTRPLPPCLSGRPVRPSCLHRNNC